MDVVELAPHMRPAGDLGHGRGLPVRGLIERPKTGIAVSLQEAVERGQVRARMLAPAIGRVAIDDRRRPLAAVGLFIPQIDPQSAGLGLAGARRQNRHRLSSACSFSAVMTWSAAASTSAVMTWSAAASTSGAASAVTLPTHAAMMARSRSTPSRA